MTKFGLDITNGFQWTTCQTLSWEPSDEQNKVQVHKQLPMRTSVWAWPRDLETLGRPKYKQVRLQCGLICGGTKVDADLDRWTFSRN